MTINVLHESAVRTKWNNSQLGARLETKDEQEQQPDWQHANPNNTIWIYDREYFPESSRRRKKKKFITLSGILQKHQPLARFVIVPKCKTCCQHMQTMRQRWELKLQTTFASGTGLVFCSPCKKEPVWVWACVCKLRSCLKTRLASSVASYYSWFLKRTTKTLLKCSTYEILFIGT